jgi:hypothetical protein
MTLIKEIYYLRSEIMKRIISGILGAALLSASLFGGASMALENNKMSDKNIEVPQWRSSQNITNDKYMLFKDKYDINRDTSSLGGAQSKYYSKYIEYTAPNGKPIRIVAMDKVTDDQILYAYNLLSFYIKNIEALGKGSVANQMADNEAILILPNGADRDGNTPDEAMELGQNLNQMEIANIASDWYIENDYEHRDAAFEEIFHMVHDYGIGTTQNEGAAPEISNTIAKAMKKALPTEKRKWGRKGLWGLSSKDWLEELSEEGSLEQEYIASVIDSYYGLWEPWTEEDGGMWGIYLAKTRAEIADKDPSGYQAIQSILPKYINEMMLVDSSFKGDFYMIRKVNKPYTFKSQYLQNLSLTGKNDNNIIANDLDNVLMGNSGTNRFNGGKGEDVLQLRGKLSEYNIKINNGIAVIEDTVKNRDGVNIMVNIETIRATDKDYEINK